MTSVVGCTVASSALAVDANAPQANMATANIPAVIFLPKVLPKVLIVFFILEVPLKNYYFRKVITVLRKNYALIHKSVYFTKTLQNK
jgi:hypothetical protein